MDNPVLTALKTRRSIRSYKAEQITDEELRTVLEAGTWAPTGKGLQDPWIVAVQDAALKEKLSQMNRAFLGIDSDPFYGAPTFVLVFASRPEKWRNGVQDASLVLGNMMLAAHAIGLGSCWINREREMFDTEEGKALLKQWGLPEDVMGVGALALGYPAAEPKAPRPRKEGYCRIVR
ncbi:MAG: nitroreductase [Bacteroidales bacterium]|nr:nitroreductase [Bacteroidales bacterium]